MINQKFTDFIEKDKWKSLLVHFRDYPQLLERSISDALKKEKSRSQDRRKYFETKFKIKKITTAQLEKAGEELMESKVVGVDGTLAEYTVSGSGIYARIGVVATTYNQKKAEVLEQDFYDEFIPYDVKNIPVEDELNQLRDLVKKDGIMKRTHIEGIMLYKEREMAFRRGEKWKLVQGEIFPYRLRIGLGYLRALQPTLKLMQEIFESKNVIAVQGTTKDDPVYALLGAALKDGEYVEIRTYDRDLLDFLGSAHFTDVSGDEKALKSFISDYANLYVRGMYKIKKRAYTFYAHKDVFDEAAAIIMRDSSFRPMRGFPLLLDYSDIICSKLVSASDFKRQIEYKLAKFGALEENKDEHDIRQR